MSVKTERYAVAACYDCNFRREDTRSVALVSRAAYDHSLYKPRHHVYVKTETRRDYQPKKKRGAAK